MKEILKRFRSWATWVAVAGVVWLVLKAFGVTEKLGVTSEAWDAGLSALGALLCAFGIVNNPSDRAHF